MMHSFNSRKFLAVTTLAGGFVLGLTAHADTTITFPNFSNPTGLQLNGNAITTAGDVASDGTVLRLTQSSAFQSGSAFLTSQLGLQNNASFSSAFSFRMGHVDGIGDGDGTGADGIVFAVQTVANNVGGSGGGLGYQGLQHSLGVEFDTYDNGTGAGDPNGNHIGIDINGSVFSVATANIADRMNNGNLWNAWVDFNGATGLLEVRVTEDSSRPALPTLSYANLDLLSVLGSSSAFAGFTAGTGSGYEHHDILSWQLVNNFQPIQNPVGSVPDAASTFPLLGMSMGGIMLLGRRMKHA
jgi:hypothetical protein